MDNIREVFDIPAYYNDLANDIKSHTIQTLLTTNPLEYMRTLFVEDNKAFYHLRDELILRGIGFRKEYENNYLLGRHYEIHHVIVKIENTDSFKNINFTMHGAANFVDRFHIQSDLFFHHVPWEGVLHFLPNASSAYLQKEFEKEGFSIIPVEDYEAVSLAEEPISIIEVNGGQASVNEPDGTRPVEKAYDYAKLDLPIRHYFEGNVFSHFLSYCRKSKIEKFSDLTLDKIDEYANEKYTRSKTLDLIKEIYHETHRTYNPLPYEIPETLALFQNNRFITLCKIADTDYLDVLDEFYESDNLYDDTFPFEKVEELCHYVIDNLEHIMEERAEKRKREELESVVNDIQHHPNFKYMLSMSIQELAHFFSIQAENLPDEEQFLYDILENSDYVSFLSCILDAMNSMVSLNDTVATVISSLKPREVEVLKLRDSMTLQEAGDKMGVSRERVRQIERKATKRIIYYRKKSMIDIYFKFYSEHSKLVSLDGFCDAFNLSDPLETIIIKKLLEGAHTVRYLETIDRFINTDDFELIANTLDKVDLGRPIIEVDELRQFIPAEVMDELQDVLDMIIQTQGYLRVDDLYVKVKISIIDRINYLFEKRIHEPLRMDDEGYVYFKELMESVFGLPYDSSKRSATARIADGENVILVDSSTFFRHEEANINDAFLAALEETVDEILSTQPYADPRTIYDERKELVEAASLRSPVHLYSIIQLYFSDKYEIGRGNTLYIYRSHGEVLDTEAILLNYLANNGHEVPYDKALEDLNWKAPKLGQIMGRIDSAIMVKDKKIKTIESFAFTDEELHALRHITSQELEKGYLFTEDLAFELAFNSELESLIERTDLTHITTLSSVVKWLHKDVLGFQRMLYRSTSDIKLFEQALAHVFPDLISRAELIRFTQEKGYSEQKLATLPSTIVEENLFYPYTSAQFINANQIDFTDDVKKSLKDYLDQQFADQPYQSVFSMVGYSGALLPISTYDWTEWLIHHFAEQVGYRKVIVQYQDYRYDKLLLVKADSDIETLEDLVYYIAKHEYEGRTHEEDFAKYLASKNIIHNPRRLSHEIYNSPLFTFDHFGFFELR